MKTIKDLLNNCSSIHLFPSGKIIFKFPLGRKENITKKLSEEEIAELKSAIASWRIVEANGVLHAVKNPTGEVSTEIPSDLNLTGKTIIFGEVGSGKSTFLKTIGRKRVEAGDNVFTIESPKTLQIEDATCLLNDESSVETVLLCRPDVVLFDEIRDRRHYKQLKDLSLACENIIGSFHATNIFEAIARFSSLNGDRSYGEVSTIMNQFVHIEKGQIVNWYTLKTTLSSQLNGEFYTDGERPVTTIYDKDGDEVGWIFYFANDINIVKASKDFYCPVRDKNISEAKYNNCVNCTNCNAYRLKN
jgi:predicted PilT family ATPase